MLIVKAEGTYRLTFLQCWSKFSKQTEEPVIGVNDDHNRRVEETIKELISLGGRYLSS